MRSIVFRGFFWVTSTFFAILCMPLLLLPGRAALMGWINLYAKTICLWMRLIGGVDLQVAGREHLPAGPFILASKHQSWGDGIFMFSLFGDLTFIISDQIARYPLVGRIFRKMEVLTVDNQRGGPLGQEKRLATAMARAKSQSRSILVYPEGKLAALGQKHRYRKGIYYLYKEYGCPVVPAATNLGLRWLDKSWTLVPGPAVIEFLPPIEPGLDQTTFMTRLEERIETRSLEILPPQYTTRPPTS